MRIVAAWRLILCALSSAVCCTLPDYQFQAAALASCNDSMLNGSESDMDCGGGCAKCGAGRICRSDADCSIGSCIDRRCQATHCADESLGDGESDVDCGGGECAACGVRQHCRAATDCASNACINSECVATGCDDDHVGGAETDLNCGGGTCPACRVGQRCELGSDCASGICLSGSCSTLACANNVQDPEEQGVDCGGNCPAMCNAAANCSNHKRTELETDVDCGGGTCARCAEARHCRVNADCESDRCNGGSCLAPCGPTGCVGEIVTGGSGSGGTTNNAGGSASASGGVPQGSGGMTSAGTASGAGAPAAGGMAPAGGVGGGAGMAGVSQGGAAASGAVTGGGASSGGSAGGTAMGGATTLPEPTCSGCARLSVPLAAPADKGNFVIFLPSVMNFNSAVLTARVYRQAGSGGQIKLYVQHGGSPNYDQLFQYASVALNSINGWQDIVWNVGAANVNYDKSIVGRVGIQIIAAGASPLQNPTVVYVDSITVSGVAAGPWNFDDSGTVSPTATIGAPPNVMFGNAGDYPVSGTAVTWYSSR